MFHPGLVSSICFQRSGLPGKVKGGRVLTAEWWKQGLVSERLFQGKHSLEEDE